MTYSRSWVVVGVGLVGLSAALLVGTPRVQSATTSAPVVSTTVGAVASPVTLPPPGQALVHEYTRSDGAVCTVVLTATSSDPHPVCGAEPVTQATTPVK